MRPEELPGYLISFGQEVRSRAAIDAADAMAQSYQRAVVRSMRGPSPSPPGTPPARRTGTLARSVRPEPAVPDGPGRAISSVAPHTVYARIQQYGGHIYPVRAKALRWKAATYVTIGPMRMKKGTGYVFAMHVYLPPRPYMVMTDERRTECQAAAVRAMSKVVREALAGG